MTEDDNTKDLTEDLTGELTVDEKLDLILARLVKLEAFAEDRSRDTNPMLERIHKEVADLGIGQGEIRKEMRLMNRKFELFTEDITKMRVEVKDFDARLTDLEQRPS